MEIKKTHDIYLEDQIFCHIKHCVLVCAAAATYPCQKRAGSRAHVTRCNLTFFHATTMHHNRTPTQPPFTCSRAAAQLSSERKNWEHATHTYTQASKRNPLFRTQNGKLHAFQSKPTIRSICVQMYIVHIYWGMYVRMCLWRIQSCIYVISKIGCVKCLL